MLDVLVLSLAVVFTLFAGVITGAIIAVHLTDRIDNSRFEGAWVLVGLWAIDVALWVVWWLV